ncbi:PaaI family thioesterase [Planococcus sp. 1R117A]|uniref:PaaI family thioesterase n=1 Tax=Planococcus sp. 1R117A TaxID=3447020 RepID=UPI003EDC38AC
MLKTETDYLEWLKEHFESAPFWKNLGFKIHSIEKGEAKVKVLVADKVLNNNQTLHGGAIMSLMDVAVSVTLRSIHPELVTTVSLTTNFMNPAKEGKTVYASASIADSKSRIQYVNAEVVDEDGIIIANGVGVFSLIKGTNKN